MPKKSIFSRKRVLLFSSLLILVLVFLGLEATGQTHVFHKDTPPVTAGQATKGESSSNSASSSANPGSSDDSQPGDQKSSNGGSNNVTLLAPTGDFVSNHHPNLSGSPAPNTLTSVCLTTPGVACIISFTNGATTKSLPSQTTDRGGAAYWNNWKLQDIGITAGTWKITAKVSLNGQSKSSIDALSLEVAQ